MSNKKTKRPFRTYALPHTANHGKLDKIKEVYSEYIPLLTQAFGWQYRRLLNGDGVWNRADPKHLTSVLSERYKRSANNQACETLSSWTALVEQEMEHILTRSTALPKERLSCLLYANKCHQWYRNTPFVFPATKWDEKTQKYVKIPDTFEAVTPEELKFLRRLVKHVKKRRVSLPDVSRTRTMKLDGTVCQWEESKTSTFSYWLKFSTLTKFKPVMIPLTSYRHAEEKTGKWSNTAQVRVEKDGTVRFSLCKDITPETTPVPQGGEIGMDFGMNTLFATSMGDQFGQQYYRWLQERDKEIIVLERALRRNGIKPSNSKHYKALQQRIREYSINEVNRVLNRIIAVYGPSAIIVERLDFRGGGLSRKLNRLLQRVGLAQVYKKLDMLAQETGVKIVKVPAPYTSQGCSGCDYVDDRNRKGSEFSCRFCGKKQDAGTNASRKVESRRSWQQSTLHASNVQVLALCDATFTTRWGCNPAVLRKAGRRQSRAISSKSLIADGLDTQPETLVKGPWRNVIMVPVSN